MVNILFICTANQFRSPIAAACFRKKLIQANHSEDWIIASAGIWTEENRPAHPKALEAANQLGLDLQYHRTREVTAEMLEAADLVVAMEPNHLEALQAEFPRVRSKICLLLHMANKTDDSIPDPAANHFRDSDKIAALIFRSVSTAFDEIVNRVKLTPEEDGGQQNQWLGEVKRG